MLPIFFEVEYIIDAIYLRAEKKKIPNFARYQNLKFYFSALWLYFRKLLFCLLVIFL